MWVQQCHSRRKKEMSFLKIKSNHRYGDSWHAELKLASYHILVSFYTASQLFFFFFKWGLLDLSIHHVHFMWQFSKQHNWTQAKKKWKNIFLLDVKKRTTAYNSQKKKSLWRKPIKEKNKEEHAVGNQLSITLRAQITRFISAYRRCTCRTFRTRPRPACASHCSVQASLITFIEVCGSHLSATHNSHIAKCRSLWQESLGACGTHCVPYDRQNSLEKIR